MRTPAQTAAGIALLHHVSPGGGSSSVEIDAQRAEEVARDITGPELLSMLIDAAECGGENARLDARFYRIRITSAARGAAYRSDSLALWKFLDEFEKENAS